MCSRRWLIPEGPECLTLVAQLREKLDKPDITAIDILSGRYTRHGPPEGFDALRSSLPRKLLSIDCKGKFIYFTLSGDGYIFNTLGMTGGWTVVAADNVPKNSRAAFTLSDSRTLLFSDPRNFGTLKFVEGRRFLDKKLASLGWDALSSTSHRDASFASWLAQDARTLAEILMDQRRFAGVGNYIKAEVLYASKFSPHRLGTSLSVADWELVCRNVQDVMQRSFASKGTTIRDYKDADGHVGSFQDELQAYGRLTDMLGNEVIRETTKDGRTTHWVPAVQN